MRAQGSSLWDSSSTPMLKVRSGSFDARAA
jgi:hypothetical protein